MNEFPKKQNITFNIFDELKYSSQERVEPKM